MNKNFFISTPIYYPSGKPHIGTAYATALADVIAKYKRLIGYDVFFLTGLDEHGQKVQEAAEKNGFANPQAYTDDVAKNFVDLWKKMDISNTKFIRTTDQYHVESVKKIFSQMIKNNDIYLGKWESLYCVGCEEDYTKEDAVVKDGELYCRVGHKLTHKLEDSYFFKMSAYQNWINEYFSANPNLIYPTSRMNEMKQSFLNNGLLDLSVSRTTFSWGVPIVENNKHVIYVWVDALFNYITALGYNSADETLFNKYWKDEQTEVVHLVGKDIARFHTIYWPIMLHSLNLRLPSKVIATGWIMAEDGKKMSKSLNNVIDPNEIIDLYGNDIFKYYIFKEFSIADDNNFSVKKMLELYNSDLANIFGNLVSRTIGMLKLYTDSVILRPVCAKSEYTETLLSAETKLLDSIEAAINNFDIKKVICMIVDYAKDLNKYVDDTKPWILKKENKFDEIHDFLFYLSNGIRIYTTLLSPILTDGIKLIKEQMQFDDEMVAYKNIKNSDILFNHKVDESKPIYVRK